LEDSTAERPTFGFEHEIRSPPNNHSQKMMEDIITKYKLMKKKLDSTKEKPNKIRVFFLFF
jgi:hypothetical protein